jgi:DNA-binding SARP family transcriptional activator
MLALHAGTVVTRDEIVDALWERAPDSAVNIVHKHICVLRSMLESGRSPASRQVLAWVAGGYELRLPPSAVDAAVFDRHRARARRARAAGDLPHAVAQLSDGLALWQGSSALAGLAGPWAPAIRQELLEGKLVAAEERADMLIQLGRPAELTSELTGLVGSHPLREGLWHRLMLAYYHSGHRPGALQAYQTICRVLADELGTEPGPALRRLYLQILHQDRRLDPPPAPS